MLTLLWLVAIQQARQSGRLLPVFGVCVLLAAALLAVPPLFENAMGDRALQQILRAEPASTFELRVQQIRRPIQQGRAEILELAIGEAVGHLGRLGGDRFRITTTSNGDLRPTGPTSATASLMLGVFQSIPTVAQDARVVAGTLPPREVPETEPFPIAIGRSAAEKTGLGVGDLLSFALNEPGGGTTDLEIVGVLEARDPAAGAWHGTNFWFELAQAGAGPSPPRLGLFVGGDEALSNLAGRLPSLRLNHTVAINLRPEVLTSDGVDEARAGLLAFDRETQRQPATRTATRLSSVLRDFATAARFQSSQALLVTVQVAAVAVFALVLVGSQLAKRSRRDRNKLRARGASRWQIVAPHALLSLAICVPAAVLAAPLAAEALQVASRLGLLGLADSSPLVTRLNLDAWLLGAGGAVLGSVCAIFPALLEDRRTFGEAGVRGAQRPTGSTVHRYGLDLVLLLVAAVLFARFVDDARSGSTSALQGGGNSALLLSPGLLVLGAALVLARIFPPVLTRLAGMAWRGGPSWLSLGLLAPARRSGTSTHLIVFILLVAAVGTVAATYGESVTRTDEARVEYEVGADIRVSGIGRHLAGSASNALAPLAEREDIAASAATSWSFVTIGSLETATRGTLIGVQSERLGDVIAAGPGFSLATSRRVLETLKPTGGLPGLELPREALSLSVWVRVDPPESALSLEAGLLDASGRLLVVPLGSPGGEWNRHEAPLPRVEEADAPLLLVSLSLGSRLPAPRVTFGTLWLGDLQVAAGGQEIALDRFAELDWSAPTALTGSGDAVQVEADAERGSVLRYDWSGLSGTSRRYLVRDWPAFPVPVVVDVQTARDLGLEVGEIITVRLPTVEIPLRVRSTVERFPTVDPSTGAILVADLETLSQAAAVLGVPGAIRVTDVWLSRSAVDPTLDSFLSDTYLPSVVLDAEALIEQRRLDPFGPGGANALFAFVYLILLILGLITLWVLFADALSDRRRDVAVLRSLGERHRGLAAQGAVEIATIALLALVPGALLGRIVAGALLAFLDSPAAGTTLVPPAVLATNWLLAGAGLACFALAALALVAASSFQASHLRVADVMRELDE